MAEVDPRIAPSNRGTPDDAFVRSLYEGGELLAAGKVAEARERLEEAYALQPKNPKAQNLLGLACFKLGVFDRAAEVYDQLVRDNPVDPTLRVNLGLVYLRLNALDRATREFETAVDLAPDHKKAQNYLGLAYAQAGEHARARDCFVAAGSPAMVEKMDQALREAAEVAAAAAAPAAEEAEVLTEPPPPEPAAEAVIEVPPVDPQDRFADESDGEQILGASDVALGTEGDLSAEQGAVDGAVLSLRDKIRGMAQERADEPQPPADDGEGEVDIEIDALSGEVEIEGEGEVDDGEILLEASEGELVDVVPDEVDEVAAELLAADPDLGSFQDRSEAIAGIEAAESVVAQAVPEEFAATLEPAALEAAAAAIEPIAGGREAPEPDAGVEIETMVSASAPTLIGTEMPLRAGAGALALPELTRSSSLKAGHGEEPFEIAADAVRVRVQGELLTRLEGLIAAFGGLRYQPELKRFRGKATDKAFGDGERRMVRASGLGRLLIDPRERAFVAFELSGESAYLREEMVFGFEAGIDFENGRVPSKVAPDLHLVHLKGRGRVLLSAPGAVQSVEVSIGTPCVVPFSVLVGWHGAVTPRIIGLPEDEEGAAIPAVELTGDGWAVIAREPHVGEARG